MVVETGVIPQLTVLVRDGSGGKWHGFSDGLLRLVQAVRITIHHLSCIPMEFAVVESYICRTGLNCLGTQWECLGELVDEIQFSGNVQWRSMLFHVNPDECLEGIHVCSSHLREHELDVVGGHANILVCLREDGMGPADADVGLKHIIDD